MVLFRCTRALGGTHEGDATARVCIGDNQIHAVQPRDGRNERQAKSGSRRIAALFGTVKSLGHRFALLLGNAGTGIDDFDTRPS